MQADRFTIKSQEAIGAARDIAAARRNPQVGPNHLLLALLEQRDTLVLPILNRLGVDIDTVRKGANEAIDLMPKLTGDEPVDPQFESEFLSTLKRADAEAKKLGDEFVASEDLLLALSEERNTHVGGSRDEI